MHLTWLLIQIVAADAGPERQRFTGASGQPETWKAMEKAQGLMIIKKN